MAIDLDAHEDWLDTLDEDELDWVVIAISEPTSQALRFEMELGDFEHVAIDLVDELLEYGPRTPAAFTLFKRYGGAEELSKGGEMEDAAYITGTTTEPAGRVSSGEVMLAINVPKGSKALYLGEGAWVLPRGLKLTLQPSGSGVMSAKIET